MGTSSLIRIAVILLLALDAGAQTAYRKLFANRPPSGSPNMTLSIASYSFGIVPIGGSKDVSVTVGNTGTATLAGSATPAGDFLVPSGSPYSIAPSANTSVVIRYAPSSMQWSPYGNSVLFSGDDNDGFADFVDCTGYPSGPENFEAPGYQRVWTTGGTVTINAQHPSTGLSMEGNYVARRVVSAQSGYARHALLSGPYVPAYAYFIYRWESGSGAIASLRDNAGVPLAEVSIAANRRLSLSMPGAASATCTRSISTGSAVTIHIWVGYMGQQGVLYWSETATRQANTADYFVGINNSTANAQATSFQYGSTANGTISDAIDKVRYAAVDIGSNPL